MISMKQTLIAALVCSVGWSNSHGETLSEAVGKLLESHPNINAGIYNFLARKQEVRQARSASFPKIDFEAGVGLERITDPAESELTRREYSLSLRQNIFTGFETKEEIARQKNRVRTAAYRIQSVSENEVLKGASAFLDVIRRWRLMKLAQENIRAHERLIDQIKLRSESGLDSGVDLDQALGRLALATSTLVAAEINLRDAETSYIATIGHEPFQLRIPEQPTEAIPKTLKEVIEIAKKEHPLLKSAEEDVRARREQYKVAKGSHYPVLDLELDKRWRENADGFEGEEDEWQAMLRLRYNIFNGFTHSARKQETAFLISEAEQIRNNAHREVVEGVRLSWMAHESARRRLPYLEQRVQSTKKTADNYRKQWNIGKRTLLDVLDSEAETLDSRREQINAEYSQHRAAYRILNGMGRLVHTLGLKWPSESIFDEAGE